jgi:hypothetical protein
MGLALTGGGTMCIRHINRATRGEFGPNGRKLWHNLFLTSDIVKILTGLSSCPPRQHGAACFGADTRNGEEDLSKHIRFLGAESKVERRRGVALRKRNAPSLSLSLPPRSRRNSPSRHTTVYRCSLEGREEAGVNVETSL